MTLTGQIYFCRHCGNTVIIIGEGEGIIICCGAKMVLLSEQTESSLSNLHVPIIEVNSESIRVKIGQPFHPMQEDHFISWIEINVDGLSVQKLFNIQTDKIPEFVYYGKGKLINARAVCNKHGLWRSHSISK